MSQIVVIGFMSDDPDLRYAQSGVPLCQFRIGENTAKRGEDAKWTNYRCTASGSLAENIAASCEKGSRVVIVGHMEDVEYTKQDGTTGKSINVIVDECGPTLRFANVEVTRNPRKEPR